MTPPTIHWPRVPLKDMDAAMLAYELQRELDLMNLTVSQKAMITSAAQVAAYLHRNQTRRVRRDMPRVPYIEHPLRNTLRLIRWGVTDPRALTAALLHDVVEDCADEIITQFAEPGVSTVGWDPAEKQRVALEWIFKSYGAGVSDAVRWVTNAPDATREDYLPHIYALVSHVKLQPFDDGAVNGLLVKAADLVDNAGSLRHQLDAGEDPKRIRRLAEKYQPVLTLVAKALSDHGLNTAYDHVSRIDEEVAVVLGLLLEDDDTDAA